MRHRTLKLGLVAAAALSTTLPLLIATQSAYADYAPSNGDVVGVGSDTLQYMIDFVADGDAYGDTGYNQIGNKNKVVNFDATVDFNARLAYGVNGGVSANCTPGTGSTAGTGNATGTNTGIPCVLNPTVVLRAGTQAVQNPNGSGAGFKALVQDMLAGNNTGTSEVINYSRASATQTTTATLPAGVDLDQLSIASDTLPMLETASPVSHAVALSNTQLSLIYAANSPNCVAWNDPRISGAVASVTTTSGSTTVTEPATQPSGDSAVTSAEIGGAITGPGIPSGDTVATVTSATSFTLTTAAGTGAGAGTADATNPNASADAIIPIIPQVGSGTRSFFLGQLSPALTNPGTCSVVAEENDPTALAQQTNPADAIEPISQGRLDLYKGVNSTGTPGFGTTFTVANSTTTSGSTSVTYTGAANQVTSANVGWVVTGPGIPDNDLVASPPAPAANSFTLTAAAGAGAGTGTITVTPPGYLLDPSCAYLSGATACGTGTVGGSPSYITNSVLPQVKPITTGTPAGIGGGLFNPTRTLYLYFRNSDILSATHFQPTSTVNWLNTLFYDPCDGRTGCSGTFGPAGAPYIGQAEGQTLLMDAGVTPLATPVCTIIAGTLSPGTC